MDCQYCKRTFSNKSNLSNHQNTAKYCLTIQGKIKIKKDKKVIHLKCSGCYKEFKQKGNLNRHYKSCIEKYYKKQLEDKDKYYKKQLEDKDEYYKKQLEDNKKCHPDVIQKKDDIRMTCNYCYKEFSTRQSLSKHKLKRCIFLQLEGKDEEYKKQLEGKDKEYKKQLKDKDKEYKQQISTLQDKLENIALKNSQTTINNHNDQRSMMINNYIDNMKPITPEMLLSYTDNLTEEHMLEGKKGITKYFCEYPMKGNVLCTDISRKKIKYKDAEGNIQTDVNLSKLRKGMFESIQPKVNKLKESMDNSDMFKIDPNLSLGDQKYYENKNWGNMCNIVNICVAISDECKGNTDTELCQMLCKKLLELNNI